MRTFKKKLLFIFANKYKWQLSKDFMAIKKVAVVKQVQTIGQDQIHDLLFSTKLSWQSIIYDLINTEQLDPWNIDLSMLSNKYLEKIKDLEEANFFISSKVLLAASLLLRIKSEILLSRDISSLDDILYGKKENKSVISEKIEEEDIPELIPRTPIPRMRKVTLQELMFALGKAIKTENRRIKKEVVLKQREKELALHIPKKSINIRRKIKELYKSIKELFSNGEDRIAFTELVKLTGENKVAAFVSLLHLDNQQKIWLEQDNHFEEIWILVKKLTMERNESEANINSKISALEEYHGSEYE